MDPFSIVAGVSGICAVTAKLISALSEFVDNVQEAPKEVRALSSDLAAFYNVFTRIRLAIEAPRISPIPDGWKDEFETLTSDCLDTVKQTKKIVDEAVVTTTTSKAQQMWRTVKITFKTKKLEVLRLRLVSQIATVSLSLDCLDESRGQHIENRLEEIHERVKELITSRENVREILVVLDKDEDDADQADYLLQDRTSRNRNGQGNSANGGNVTSSPPGSGAQAVPSLPMPNEVNIQNDLLKMSPDEQNAVDYLCNHNWTINRKRIYQSFKEPGKPGENQWKHLRIEPTAVQFKLDEFFSMNLLSWNGKVMKQYHLFDDNITKTTVQSLEQETTDGIVFPNCAEICPDAPLHAKLDIFLNFESDIDQNEFVSKTKTVASLSRQAWRSHTIALAKITKNSDCSTEASITASTWHKATSWAEYADMLRVRNEDRKIPWYKRRARLRNSLPYLVIIFLIYVIVDLKQRADNLKQQADYLTQQVDYLLMKLGAKGLQKLADGVSTGIALNTGLKIGARLLFGI